MTYETLTNLYYSCCDVGRKDKLIKKNKLYPHPKLIFNKKCSICLNFINNPEHISKVWKNIHVFCQTECYHNWLAQFN